ncbi:MAG: STAS/SEC14 domain-containing protein [Acidobacteriota bacterium]
MPIKLNEENGGKILVIHVSGTLVKEDYPKFVSEFERLLQTHGKPRLLFDMIGFHGWDAGAAWEDLKFGVHHYNDIDRMAMVGDKKWQHAIEIIFKPFSPAPIRYFDHADESGARKWLEEA